jgi:hypothetical protein
MPLAVEDSDDDAAAGDGCLRNSRTAVTVLKKIYVDEAKHAASYGRA